ncbi:MAG: gamma carbonic anhydrase family protein [Oscillospiraceae bacterium]|jgi:carbonic anhydrase/acetyltransferase-like protein (isoleucine patch superfamily)
MLVTFEGHTPEISPSCFVAENATIVGEVKIGANSSVWFGAVIRGDEDSITIGEDTSIQDNAVLHCNEGHAITVGNSVTIGHAAVVHGCKIGDNALIGMGAIVLNGAVIGENAVIGAGAVVRENDEIPAGAVAVGVPAKVVKVNEDYNRSMNSLNAAAYVQLAAEYRREAEK